MNILKMVCLICQKSDHTSYKGKIVIFWGKELIYHHNDTKGIGGNNTNSWIIKQRFEFLLPPVYSLALGFDCD